MNTKKTVCVELTPKKYIALSVDAARMELNMTSEFTPTICICINVLTQYELNWIRCRNLHWKFALNLVWHQKMCWFIVLSTRIGLGVWINAASIEF